MYYTLAVTLVRAEKLEFSCILKNTSRTYYYFSFPLLQVLCVSPHCTGIQKNNSTGGFYNA